MDRARLLMVGLPIFLFCSDIVSLLNAPPSPPPTTPNGHHSFPQLQPTSQFLHQQQSLQFPNQKTSGIGSTVNINFCTACSYRGIAVTMKNMLETTFPGIKVILANHPPPLPKRLLSKAVPFFQAGLIGIIMAGEHIFPRLGIMTPPPWYFSLRANRFGSIASVWLLGNFLQAFLQSSAAFEVYCNGELVFSKLMEQRFPSEIELRDLVGKELANSRVVDGFRGGLWS